MQVQDIAFVEDGSEFFSCADHVSKESSDRNIMAWDFRTGVVVSNQIYQVHYMNNLMLHVVLCVCLNSCVEYKRNFVIDSIHSWYHFQAVIWPYNY